MSEAAPAPAAVWAALEDVKDPEIPAISVVDLGLVHSVGVEGARVRVAVLPTYLGCPALEIIGREIEARLLRVPGVKGVEVAFVLDPPWSSDRITAAGRARLQAAGIAPPPRGGGFVPLDDLLAAPAPCPFCGSADTRLENHFGPTACRSIHYCSACRNPFERIKAV